MENSSPLTGRAEWRFPGVARVLRCDRKTLLQPHSRLKPTNIQVDTYLLRLVNRQAGRLKRCSDTQNSCVTHGEETRGILAISGQAARNEFQQLPWRQHTIAKNSCVTHGVETRGSLAIGGQAARNEFQQLLWRPHIIVK